jgi:deazaflavin-dependent oxidoreductase (nitroreductase family)
VKISLTERAYAWVETGIINRLVPQNEVGPVFKWIFKAPIPMYRLGLGWMIGGQVLLLTTTGRKSGKPRNTPLEYQFDAQSGRYRVAAGWGGNTDWYRNARADPHVTVQVGRRKFAALAEPSSDEEVAEYMMAASQRHPRMDDIWNRWSDRPLDGTPESYVYAARFFPSLWLHPQPHAAGMRTRGMKPGG